MKKKKSNADMPPDSNSVGRPTDYNEEYNEQAYKLCLLGATDKELANFFEVSEVTINAWKNKFPKFLKSLRKGKEQADAEVAEKLFQRATGYRWKEQQLIKGKEAQIVDVEKSVPPDPVSMIFWLKNRQPSKWREKTEQSITMVPTVIKDDIPDDGKSEE